ncbi:MAG: alpha-galactosidase [Bifidobacterium sp.]|nr:alpha-galactosidase [Bifidobacterium sp.]
MIYAEAAHPGVAFAVVIVERELPRIVHWGRPLEYPETLLNSVAALKPQRVSGVLDETPWPGVLPTQAEGWTGSTRFVARRAGVELFCKFVVSEVRIDAAKAALTVAAEDSEQGVALTWICELTASGLVRQRAVVRNTGQGELAIDKVELGFTLPAGATEVLTTTGHHLRERHPQRQLLQQERIERVSMVGRPDFDASLLLTVGVPGFGFERGEAYAVHTAWSGNSVLAAERNAYTQTQISGGEVLLGGEIMLKGRGEENLCENVAGAAGAVSSAGAGNDLEPNDTASQAGAPNEAGAPAEPDSYATPWIYGAYGDGLNEIAQRFHSFVRAQHPELSAKPRPVILNTWEAVYFEHDFDTLKALADKAKASGVERFVVDDGWFGARRDDTRALGDWQISQQVWPEGEKSLKALADYVHGLGLEFGLWFEPEMISPDSDTARAHPDWILRPTVNRLPMQGRSQQVIDLTNPAARDYTFGCMDALVGELGIDYIKWDHNKLVTEAVSPRTGRPAVHAQTLAVYGIFRELRRHYMGLEIESCSSGGGRIDLGILEFASRVWVSDCVDPVERATIQRYTSLLVPPEMMGEHVGASPAHSTLRATSQQLRAAMTFFGHMGIEWNLLKQSPESLAALKSWVEAFKAHRSDFASGLVVHNDSPDPAVQLDGIVSADGSRAVYRFTQRTTSATYPAAPVHLPGLDADALYRVLPLAVNRELGCDVTNAQSVSGWWNADGVTLDGRALQTYGLRVPSLHPAQAVLFETVRQ